MSGMQLAECRQLEGEERQEAKLKIYLPRLGTPSVQMLSGIETEYPAMAMCGRSLLATCHPRGWVAILSDRSIGRYVSLSLGGGRAGSCE